MMENVNSINAYDEIEKVAFQLEHNADIKAQREIDKVRNYADGYKQAISDLLSVVKDFVEESYDKKQSDIRNA